MTDRRFVRAASVAGARGRGHHTLAPALGEATAAATVAVVVGGIALVITGIGVLAMGLTLGARYEGTPPPNAASLGLIPILLGLLTLVLGGALTAGGLAVIGDVPRARLVTGILAALTALSLPSARCSSWSSRPRPSSSPSRSRPRRSSSASPRSCCSGRGADRRRRVRVARPFLLVGAIVWLIVAGAALHRRSGRAVDSAALPPLAIDADALGGALTAVAAAGRGWRPPPWLVRALVGHGRRPRTVGVLLACVLAAVFVALAAAAAASAVREAALAPWLWLGCVAAGAAAIGYA